MPEDFSQYLERRFFNQLRYYEVSAFRARQRQVILEMVQFAIISSLPVLIMMNEVMPFSSRITPLITAGLALVAVVLTLQRTFGPHPDRQRGSLLSEMPSDSRSLRRRFVWLIRAC